MPRRSQPHEVSKPLDPMQQYRRWQWLEHHHAEMVKVLKQVKNLEPLLSELPRSSVKKLHDAVWAAHDALQALKDKP